MHLWVNAASLDTCLPALCVAVVITVTTMDASMTSKAGLASLGIAVIVAMAPANAYTIKAGLATLSVAVIVAMAATLTSAVIAGLSTLSIAIIIARTFSMNDQA